MGGVEVRSEVVSTMMMLMRFQNRLGLALASMVISAGLISCASWDASSQEQLLSAAGFRIKTPETDEQVSIYQAMEPYKLLRGELDDAPLFVYKQEKKGIVYVGRDPEYQRYSQLALQRNLAQQDYMAAQMNQSMAYRWNYWGGPGRVWW